MGTFGSGGTPGDVARDLFNGTMRGLTQGIAKLGFEYAVQEFDLPPLLANLGFSVIAAGLEGLIIPADPNNPNGPRKGMMENIWEKFEGSVLNMLGVNPLPNINNPKYENPDESFNQALYDLDMANYYWQKSVYWFGFLRDRIYSLAAFISFNLSM